MHHRRVHRAFKYSEQIKSYDLIAQAFTGLLSLTGEPGGPPARSHFSPVDQATGYHAVIGIKGALIQCTRTGHVVKIEASLFDSAVGLLGYLLQNCWLSGTEPKRPVPAMRRSALTRRSTQRTRQSSPASPTMDSGTPQSRRAARRFRHERHSFLARPHAWRAVRSSANRSLGLVLHDGNFQTVASPLRVDGERLALRLRPPALGEHSRVVLAELGYEPEKIDALIADGVVGTHDFAHPGRCP